MVTQRIANPFIPVRFWAWPPKYKLFYLTKKSDQALEFDIDLAITQDKNNPVYYIQSAFDTRKDNVMYFLSAQCSG